MRTGDKAWTEAETATLTEMRMAGASVQEIVAVIGRSNASVANKTANMTSLVRSGPVPAPSVRTCATRSEYITRTLFDDPPDGRSALDQRGQT